MKLQENTEVFAELIAATATHIGLPEAYVGYHPSALAMIVRSIG